MGIWHEIVRTITSKDFWQGTAATVTLAILGILGKMLWQLILRLIDTPTEFEISGYWIGTCELPSYSTPQVEVWRYSRQGQHVKIKFFAYKQKDKRATKWRGGAIFRGHALSGYYYLVDRKTWESGVIALELNALQLKGVYAQFDPKHDDEPLFVSATERAKRYSQKQIDDVPFRVRARMFFGYPPYRTYDEAMQVYGQTMAGSEGTPAKTAAGQSQ